MLPGPPTPGPRLRSAPATARGAGSPSIRRESNGSSDRTRDTQHHYFRRFSQIRIRCFHQISPYPHRVATVGTLGQRSDRRQPSYPVRALHFRGSVDIGAAATFLCSLPHYPIPSTHATCGALWSSVSHVLIHRHLVEPSTRLRLQNLRSCMGWYIWQVTLATSWYVQGK